MCCAVQQVDCGRPELAASQAFSTLCVRASAMLNGSRPLQAQAPRCALCGRPLATLGPVRPQKAEAKRWVAVSAKRRGGDSAGRSRRPLLVSVDPYGSDLWRLDPVIQLLRDGAVWPQQPSSCTAASSSLNVYACTLLLTCWTCAAQLGIIPTDR